MTVTVKGSAKMMLLTADSLKNGDKVIPARELTEVTKVSIPVKKSSTYNLACFLKDGTTVADASSTYKISSDNAGLIIKFLSVLLHKKLPFHVIIKRNGNILFFFIR